ncbi:hypothetical protein [Pseudomonas arsenicoxydans]|nr:hypothetical protein [Pseudomonas arsenicoxydans]
MENRYVLIFGLASHYGVTPGAGGVVAGGHDTATIINGMLNDHSLKVDTV